MIDIPLVFYFKRQTPDQLYKLKNKMLKICTLRYLDKRQGIFLGQMQGTMDVYGTCYYIVQQEYFNSHKPQTSVHKHTSVRYALK